MCSLYLTLTCDESGYRHAIFGSNQCKRQEVRRSLQVNGLHNGYTSWLGNRILRSARVRQCCWEHPSDGIGAEPNQCPTTEKTELQAKGQRLFWLQILHWPYVEHAVVTSSLEWIA
jgi:hypothetical protein